MRLIGSYFELTDRVAGLPAGQAASVATTAEGQAGASGSDKLLISVAKRLVKSAVRRNTVKRIVREAWRAANKGASGGRHGAANSIRQGTGKGIARQVTQPGGHQESGSTGEPERVDAAPAAVLPAARTCLVRLKRYPGSGRSGKAAGGAGNRPGTGAPDQPSLAMIKRGLRQDADQLFATFLAAPSRPHRRGASRTGSRTTGAPRVSPPTAGTQ